MQVKSPSRAKLRRLTKQFFDRHWDAATAEPHPSWITLEPASKADSLQQGGCYAVFNPGGELLYVGVALAEKRGHKPNANAGLIRRLFRHVIKSGPFNKGSFVPKRDAWDLHGGISEIRVISFPKKYRYLAASLEVYLIKALKPPVNKSHVRVEDRSDEELV